MLSCRFRLGEKFRPGGGPDPVAVFVPDRFEAFPAAPGQHFPVGSEMGIRPGRLVGCRSLVFRTAPEPDFQVRVKPGLMAGRSTAETMTMLLEGVEVVAGERDREQEHSPDVVGLWKCVSRNENDG